MPAIGPALLPLTDGRLSAINKHGKRMADAEPYKFITFSFFY